MPYDPSQLPDLKGDYETPQQKFKDRINVLAQLMGKNFTFNNGLRYDNGIWNATMNNRGMRASYPVGGGQLDASISGIGSDDPYYSLKYLKNFR